MKASLKRKMKKSEQTERCEIIHLKNLMAFSFQLCLIKPALQDAAAAAACMCVCLPRPKVGITVFKAAPTICAQSPSLSCAFL